MKFYPYLTLADEDELQPLLAKASMLVMEALPAEIATAFAEETMASAMFGWDGGSRYVHIFQT